MPVDWFEVAGQIIFPVLAEDGITVLRNVMIPAEAVKPNGDFDMSKAIEVPA